MLSGRCLGGVALRRMVCILSRESVKQTVQPFKGTMVHSSVWDSVGINNKNNISCRLLLMQCFTLPHLNKAEASQDSNSVLLSF